MDMQKSVDSAMANLVESGKIEKMIEDRLEKTIKDLIDDALKSYSDFGKELKAKIEQAVKINFKEFSLPEYNTVIGNHVISIIQDTMYPVAKAAIEENLKKFFKPLEKDSYTFSEIVELYKEAARQWHDAEPGERFTARIEEKNGGFTYISIDQKPNQSRYQCQFRIGIHGGKIFSLYIDGSDAARSKNPGYHGFGDTLFKMYAAGVTIIDDDEDISGIAYFDEEYDD